MYSENSGSVMPYRASISRLGCIFSCGRSICCSTFRSAMPGMSPVISLICLPSENIRFRSSPNSLMAMLALVPESMASMRWLMGCPISMFAPVMPPSFSRTSAINSWRERSFNSKGASSSDTFTPKACSSSSARPVFRATVCISGICNNNSSALRPMRSLSSSETPGSVLRLIVNEPSLKEGRKLCPSVKKHPSAMRNKATVLPSVTRLCFSTHTSDVLYTPFSRLATNDSFISPLVCFCPSR